MLITADTRTLPVKANCAQLVYADPPFTDAYDSTEILTSYRKFTQDWIYHATRCMADDSYLLINTQSKIRYDIETCMRKYRSYISFVQDLIWFYNFGTYTKKKFVESHQTILVYKRGTPFFNWQSVAIPSQRMLSKDLRADHRGRTPPTVLQYPRVPGNSRERDYLRHAKGRSCQPIELCTTFVRAFSRPNDIVLDLFTGSGSMYIAAKRQGRRTLGFDIHHLYLTQAHDRYKEGWKRHV